MAGGTITVREVGPDDWRTWRALRLASLAEAPDAFHSRLEDWLGAGEHVWRERLAAPGGVDGDSRFSPGWRGYCVRR